MLTATGSRPDIDPDANLNIRVQEEFFGAYNWPGGNQPPDQAYLGPDLDSSATKPQILNGNNLGGGGTGVDVAGRRLAQMVSPAAGFSVRRGGGATVPLSQQFQAAGALTGILTGRRVRQYLVQVAVRMTAVNTGIWNFALTDSDGGFLLSGGNRAGLGWVHNPAVNAGRWTCMHRLTNGGALVVGVDSGVTTAAFHLLGLRYTEGAVPRVEWLLDGQPIQIVEGDANMLVNGGGGTSSPFWQPETGWSGPAGSTSQCGPALYQSIFLG